MWKTNAELYKLLLRNCEISGKLGICKTLFGSGYVDRIWIFVKSNNVLCSCLTHLVSEGRPNKMFDTAKTVWTFLSHSKLIFSISIPKIDNIRIKILVYRKQWTFLRQYHFGDICFCHCCCSKLWCTYNPIPACSNWWVEKFRKETSE